MPIRHLFLPIVSALLVSSAPTTSKPVQLKQEQALDSIYLRGRIVESTGRPVRNTRLRLVQLHLEAVSDNEGEFAFSIPIKRAVHTTEDKLLVMDGLHQAQFLKVKPFAAGPVILTVLTPNDITAVECSMKDIIGKKRAGALRAATRSHKRNTPDSTYNQHHFKQPFQRKL